MFTSTATHKWKESTIKIRNVYHKAQYNFPRNLLHIFFVWPDVLKLIYSKKKKQQQQQQQQRRILLPQTAN